MSELSREEIIKAYERNKKQEEKVDSLSKSIDTLNETLGKFMSLIPGSKDKEDKKEDKHSVPTKIEDKKESKESKKDDKKSDEDEKSILSFLGF